MMYGLQICRTMLIIGRFSSHTIQFKTVMGFVGRKSVHAHAIERKIKKCKSIQFSLICAYLICPTEDLNDSPKIMECTWYLDRVVCVLYEICRWIQLVQRFGRFSVRIYVKCIQFGCGWNLEVTPLSITICAGFYSFDRISGRALLVRSATNLMK